MGYINWIGLGKVENEEQTTEKYVPILEQEMAERYLKYVEDLFNYHKDRQQTIESKNSLLIGQVSIVVSIVALFIPLFNEQLNSLSPYVIVPLVFVFIFIIFHYSLTIRFSITNLEIHKRRFAVGKTSTITKTNRAEKEIDFLNEQIKDLVYCINVNNTQIRKIGENLIFAGRNFKIANFTFLSLTVVLVVILLFVKKQTPKVNVDNLSDIPCCNLKDSNTKSLPENNVTNYIQLNNKIEIQSKKIDTLVAKINVLIENNKTCKPPKKHRKPKSKCPCPCPQN